MSDALIQALQNPAIYPHRVDQFEVIQTHLSWIILTGKYAYKIKKPLNLGFQDFTTLNKRKYYCQLEASLNKRLAPDLYIESLPITGTIQAPSFNKQEPIIEYAVKMHQFSQDQLLSNLLIKNKLNNSLIKAIAQKIAQFHLEAPCTQDDFGSPQSVFAPMQDNFASLKTHYDNVPLLNELESWTTQQYQLLQPFLAARKSQGFIRACHGDFHLGNIVLFNKKLTIFDCIEFNESFRWIDVMNDIGFLAMDLAHFQQAALAYLFVNQYLEFTNDYAGLQLLKFYQCYRAIVRAKISALQLKQLLPSDPLTARLRQDVENLLTLAKDYTKNPTLSLTITHGLSGAGKTRYTENLMMQQNAIRLRSDVIRKHLHKLHPFEATPQENKSLLYSSQNTQTLYLTLKELARDLLQAKWPVIIDATCLTKWQRQLFLDLAKECHVPIRILAFEAPLDVLRERILARISRKDASDADLKVLEMQLAMLEPLSEAEKSLTTFIPS